MPFRYNITRAAETHAFTPNELAEEKKTGEGKMTLKVAELGALFMNNLKDLPKQHARLVWECELDTSPPACIRPRKPKVWLTCTTNVNKGTAIELQ